MAASSQKPEAARSGAFTHSIPADIRDYPEWRRGRIRYGIWMIPAGTPPLAGYLRDIRERLCDLLHPAGRREPHVTLFVCGFEQPRIRWDDDFTPEQLERQAARLGCARGPACSLPLLPADSFASAAYLPVGDPQSRLRGWRDHLARDAPEIRQAAYVPHVTIGLYHRRVPAGEIRERLAALPPPPPALAVRELCYATYDGRDQHGPLEIRRRLSLDTVHGSPPPPAPAEGR
ncbi:2'-5' RNA ligase family protein [Enterovirga sp.]|uniref:2'-5' RNA ligase family protein n=1 Tax=Enterovirga sp. TaxID=2026350 RepID=UPI002C28E581|nr:2'-5' RNA ligase family protein [Enterovirga sp.]HMO27965.1 2'-5' RNA ligase family protein [Enterovirga sp.]